MELICKVNENSNWFSKHTLRSFVQAVYKEKIARWMELMCKVNENADFPTIQYIQTFGYAIYYAKKKKKKKKKKNLHRTCQNIHIQRQW